MRMKAWWAAIAAALVLTAALPVSAQGHVLTCANTRLFAAQTIVERFSVGGFENPRLGACTPGRGSTLAGKYHRHIVYYMVYWTAKTPAPSGQGWVFYSCHGRAEVSSLSASWQYGNASLEFGMIDPPSLNSCTRG
jgi:hypothetical protein